MVGEICDSVMACHSCDVHMPGFVIRCSGTPAWVELPQLKQQGGVERGVRAAVRYRCVGVMQQVAEALQTAEGWIAGQE